MNQLKVAVNKTRFESYCGRCKTMLKAGQENLLQMLQNRKELKFNNESSEG